MCKIHFTIFLKTIICLHPVWKLSRNEFKKWLFFFRRFEETYSHVPVNQLFGSSAQGKKSSRTEDDPTSGKHSMNQLKATSFTLLHIRVHEVTTTQGHWKFPKYLLHENTWCNNQPLASVRPMRRSARQERLLGAPREPAETFVSIHPPSRSGRAADGLRCIACVPQTDREKRGALVYPNSDPCSWEEGRSGAEFQVVNSELVPADCVW